MNTLNLRQIVGTICLMAALIAPTYADDSASTSTEQKFLSNIRQVTSDFEKAGEGYFSPDGTKLMWTSTRTEDNSSQLFIADFQLPE